jgi:hypothetical protein
MRGQDVHTLSHVSRLAAGVLACIAWFGLARYLVAEASKLEGDWLAALWENSSYLTDLSNLLLAVVMTGVALGSRLLSRPAIVGWAVVAIATVGVGFWLIGGTLSLATSALENILLHAVTPWAALLFWLLLFPKGGLRWTHALAWMLWPTCYWAYAMTRGVATGEFAYKFMDLAANPVSAVALSIGSIVLLYVAWASVLVLLDKALARNRRNAGSASA